MPQLQCLVQPLHDALDPYLKEQATQVLALESLEPLLETYNALFLQQIQEDAAYTLSQLTDVASVATAAFQQDLKEMAQTKVRLEALTNRAAAWPLIQWFYHLALSVADGQYSLLHKQPPALPRALQEVILNNEVLIPNLLAFDYKLLLPSLRFWLSHFLMPWRSYHHEEYIQSLMPLTKSLESIRQAASEGLHWHRHPDVVSLDPATTNIIFTFSHRLGFLDIPLVTNLRINGMHHASWVNTAAYPAFVRRKMRRAPHVVIVRGQQRVRKQDILDRSVALMRQGMPVVVVLDGVQSNLMYGQINPPQQGLRLLVDESIRQMQAEKTGRKTVVVPMTMDDPIAFILGHCKRVDIRFHPPIQIEEPSHPKAYKSTFHKQRYNGGDALLNQVEALSLYHSYHLHHGWKRPEVQAATASKYQQPANRGLRGWLQGRTRCSLFELSR